MAPYQVYADWLSEQDDPLGELIALQCASPPAIHARRRDGEQPQRDDEHVTALQQAQLQAALDRVPLPEDLRLEWKNGFLVSARIRRTKATTPPLWPMLEQLVTSRCGAFLRGLDVMLSQFGETTSRFSDALVPIAKPPLLQRLVLRGAAQADTGALRAAFPLLTELEIVIGVALELVSLGPATCESLEVGGRFQLNPLQRTFVGRSYASDIVVAHPNINRSNFTIEHSGGRWYFAHLGGPHPVLFNGAPTTANQRVLSHGDTLEPVDGLKFRFVDPP